MNYLAWNRGRPVINLAHYSFHKRCSGLEKLWRDQSTYFTEQIDERQFCDYDNTLKARCCTIYYKLSELQLQFIELSTHTHTF